ncbi:MAG: hypothetical protein IPG08_15990 [Sphingobacteriaceae bacterium]|nr:hypothetical protein [Sphingobacteriaceae bacterium]
MSKELSIKESLSSKELFEAFKQQLKKDLSECGCESDFIDVLTSEFELIKQSLITVLKAREKKAGFNIQQLLYRVDINEKQLSERLQKNKEEDYLSVVSELIIKRILQKVVLKKHFSNNGH